MPTTRGSRWIAAALTVIGVVVVAAATAGFPAVEHWAGTVELKLTNREDYTWSVRLILTNNDPRAAGGFLLKLRLKNAGRRSMTLKSETNLIVDSSHDDIGVWNLRPARPFGLSGNGAVYSGSSFKVLFSGGPLYGNCIEPEILQPEVIVFTSECSAKTCPEVCGDGNCSAGETCESCPMDCLNSPKLKCPDICGDGICSGGESAEICSMDCRPVACNAPFQFIFGWNLNTTLLAAGVVVAVLFALISGLCFKYRKERQQLLVDGVVEKVPPPTLRRVPGSSEYENEDDDILRDEQPMKPAPAVDIYAEYDEEAAPEHIPIESRRNIFYEKPWKKLSLSASTSAASVMSPEASNEESGAALVALSIGQAEPRVPDYLQDIPQASPMFVSSGLRKRSRGNSLTLHDAEVAVELNPAEGDNSSAAIEPTY